MKDELKAWRTRVGLTQVQAADALKVPLATYRGWENGKKPALEGLVGVAMTAIEHQRGNSQPLAAVETVGDLQSIPALPSMIGPAPEKAWGVLATGQRPNIAQTLARSTVTPMFKAGSKKGE